MGIRGLGMRTAVELGCVPDGLVSHLWHPDGMRRRACRSGQETIRSDGVVHVSLVVGAVKVLSIPASKEPS